MSIMSEKYINAPITKKDIDNLAAGDMAYISGTIYTARDAAHKRLYETILEGKDIPLELENNIIYYLGSVSGKRRAGDRLCRSDNQQSYG